MRQLSDRVALQRLHSSDALSGLHGRDALAAPALPKLEAEVLPRPLAEVLPFVFAGLCGHEWANTAGPNGQVGGAWTYLHGCFLD